ncbi:hypothetical protein FACS1894111_12240 [Clostridia bacterium]|nr:hypothetical protein FACS1894111_12240 [Clostridia bacterium]
MDSTAAIGTLKGIGPKTEKLFHSLGVYTLGDILLNYPRGYELQPPMCNLRQLYDGTYREGLTAAVQGKITSPPPAPVSRCKKAYHPKP